MTSTPRESAALDHLVAPWVAKIAEFFAAIVEAILTIGENVRDLLHELAASCRKAGQPLAASSRLSRLMMSKLETIGHHARLPRLQPLECQPCLCTLSAMSLFPILNDAAGCGLLADIDLDVFPSAPDAGKSSWVSKSVRLAPWKASGGHSAT